MTAQLPVLLSLVITYTACGNALTNSAEPPSEPHETLLDSVGSETHGRASKKRGVWVSTGVDFGPCAVLPESCIVGDRISAHSGPGTAGGCYTYVCK